MSRIDVFRRGVRRIREGLDPRVPALVHPEWTAELPWVVQGTTTRGTSAEPFDLGLFSNGSESGRVRANWDRLLGATGMRAAFHARQVHGADVQRHDAPEGAREGGIAEDGAALAGERDRRGTAAPGLRLAADCDGHVTSAPGVLLAVSAADCVPIFVVDPSARAVAVLHAGWRGVAAGMLERGLESLARAASRPELRVHLGPSICGSCYEVGPEVFEAVGLTPPARPMPIDLRAVLAERAVDEGVAPAHITVSEHCTRCTASGLFSHRGGDRGRHVGYVGIRV